MLWVFRGVFLRQKGPNKTILDGLWKMLDEFGKQMHRRFSENR